MSHTPSMRRRSASPLLAIAAAATYLLLLRRPVLTWGATDEEAAATLPGDVLLPDPSGVSTRAVWIDAPPSAVWPWPAQMGPSPRGGAYTYDWIENLMGLNMHSADEVLAEFQHPEVGETIAFGTNVMRPTSSSRSECWPGARRTATGCGRSSCVRGRAHTPGQPQPLPALLRARWRCCSWSRGRS